MLKTDRLQLVLLFLFLINILFVISLLMSPINIDYIMSDFMDRIPYTSLYHFAFFITKLGSSPFLIPLTIVIMIIFVILFKEIKQAFIISTMTLVSYLLNELIKTLVKRERPLLFEEAHALGYSYPSGHAMITLVFYGLLIYFINKKIKHKMIRIVLMIITISLIIMIGFSRVILNVHYISDVLSGFLFGFILLRLAIFLNKKMKLF